MCCCLFIALGWNAAGLADSPSVLLSSRPSTFITLESQFSYLAILHKILQHKTNQKRF